MRLTVLALVVTFAPAVLVAQAKVWPPPCNLSLTGSDICGGVIRNDFLTRPTRGKLNDAEKALDSVNSDEQWRDGDCGQPNPCLLAQYVQPSVNIDSRHMDLEAQPNDVGVLVGVMKFDAGEPSDVYYGIGGNFVNGHDKRRAFIVVTATADRTKKIGGHVIAHWTLYGHNMDSGKFGPLVGKDGKFKTGDVIKCDSVHMKDLPFASSFLTCESATQVEAYSTHVGISFAVARHVFSCQRQRRAKASPEMCQKQRVAKLKIALALARRRGMHVMDFDSAVKLLATVTGSLHSNPYWFSCSLGCCTASM